MPPGFGGAVAPAVGMAVPAVSRGIGLPAGSMYARKGRGEKTNSVGRPRGKGPIGDWRKSLRRFQVKGALPQHNPTPKIRFENFKTKTGIIVEGLVRLLGQMENFFNYFDKK
jgi:hypothetical protein